MRISAIAMVRNEADIIQDTIDHIKDLATDIHIYDDCSTDSTVEILKANGVNVIKGEKWVDTSEGRNAAEGKNRNAAYFEAIKKEPDYIYCFDADEFAYFDGIDFTLDYYRLRLFDFYATKDDIDTKWNEHKWMGPEYRNITMLFKPTRRTRFIQREPVGVGPVGKNAGYVKHYSKCISEERWEEDCDYYAKYFPRYAKKWADRRGKYIHKKSDFGRPLIKWEDRGNNSLTVRI